MQPSNSKNNQKTPDPIFVLMGSILFLLLGMIMELAFFAFAGLGFFIISIILFKKDGLVRPSFSFKGFFKKRKSQNNLKAHSMRKTLDNNSLEKSQKKQKQLEDKEHKLITKYKELQKPMETQNSNMEKLKEELEDFKLEENTVLRKEKMKKSEKEQDLKKLLKEIDKVHQERKALQKEEILSEQQVPKSIKENTEILDNLEIFKEKPLGRYDYVTFRVKEKVIQLLSDEELENLEQKKRMKYYSDSKFRKYCEEVRYNDIFLIYQDKLIPIAMVDGVYVYRDMIRMQLCNSKIAEIKIHNNDPNIVKGVAEDFAKVVLNTSLLPLEKLEELNKFSANRLQKMILDYKNDILHPLDYVLGDKIL